MEVVRVCFGVVNWGKKWANWAGYRIPFNILLVGLRVRMINLEKPKFYTKSGMQPQRTNFLTSHQATTPKHIQTDSCTINIQLWGTFLALLFWQFKIVS